MVIDNGKIQMVQQALRLANHFILIANMGYYSYIVRRDYGFAPNPFGKYCTLATCKQDIRKRAEINDWIFGTGSAEYGKSNHLIFILKVTEKMTFQEYWEDARFYYKKPIMNGSQISMYGDNIYHLEEGDDSWLQENSHHSYEGGAINEHNLNRDLSGKYVLISDTFVYLGRRSILLPEKYRENIVKIGPGYKSNCIESKLAEELINEVVDGFGYGLKSLPNQIIGEFTRYNGK